MIDRRLLIPRKKEDLIDEGWITASELQTGDYIYGWAITQDKYQIASDTTQNIALQLISKYSDINNFGWLNSELYTGFGGNACLSLKYVGNSSNSNINSYFPYFNGEKRDGYYSKQSIPGEGIYAQMLIFEDKLYTGFSNYVTDQSEYYGYTTQGYSGTLVTQAGYFLGIYSSYGSYGSIIKPKDGEYICKIFGSIYISPENVTSKATWRIIGPFNYTYAGGLNEITTDAVMFLTRDPDEQE